MCPSPYRPHPGTAPWDGCLRDEVTKTLDEYLNPLSLAQLSIQDDIITYATKDGAAHEFDALEFLAASADKQQSESDHRRDLCKSS
ncbi:MAG: hypothetical protein DWI15_01695 [Planctomycetota bacterium]|nr:MAG: hypothetical protein DWI15_01695 [Planctomycetota bacterium]